MNSTHKTFRAPGLPGVSAERARSGAPRFTCGMKVCQPLATSNRAFVRAWALRRARLVAAAKARLPR